MTCRDVLERIELYAAEECGEPEKSAIRQHLVHCPACSNAEQEARELMGLVELRLQEPERLGRLQARLRIEERRPRSVKLLPFAGRAAALAATLLLAVGLSVWFRGQPGNQNPLVVAWAPANQNLPVGIEHQPAVALFKAKENNQVYELDLGGKTAKQFRQQITTARDRLPHPPLINRTLEIRNASDHDVRIYVGDEGSELTVNLSGPGVMTAPAPANVLPDFLVKKTITRKPGESYLLPISHLVYGSRDNVRAAYWTEPGDYTLILRYKVAVSTVNGQDYRLVTVRSPALRIDVRNKGN